MKQYKPRTRLHLSDPNEGNLHVSKPWGGEAMPIVPKPSISLSESSIPMKRTGGKCQLFLIFPPLLS
nr:hypothetical protein Q903MT_gene5068 [Picea sitchensis]